MSLTLIPYETTFDRVDRKQLHFWMEFLLRDAVNRQSYLFSLTINYNPTLNSTSRASFYKLDDFTGPINPASVPLYKGWLKAKDFKSCIQNEKNVVDIIKYNLSKIDCIEFAYIAKEYHEKGELTGLPHFHLLFSIRSPIGGRFNVEKLTLSIGQYLYINCNYQDTLLKPLKKFMDAKKFFNYMIKNDKIEENHQFVIYNPALPTSKVHLDNIAYHVYDRFLEVGQFFPVHDFWNQSIWNPPYPINPPLPSWYGLLNPPTTFTKFDSVDSLSTLFRIFLIKNKLFYFQGGLYSKCPNSRFTYQFCYTVKELFNTASTLEFFYSSLKSIFPFQMDIIPFQDIVNNHISTLLDRLTSFATIYFSIPTIELNTHLIEFTDGIYNKRTGTILYHRKYSHIDGYWSLPFNCYYYFNNSIGRLRFKKPRFWLDRLSLNFPDPKSLDEFCSSFAVLFHGDTLKSRFIEVSKQDKTVFIEGVSNSGKTTLLADVISTLVGKHNVGMLGTSSSFPLETIRNKSVLLFDEFKYKKTHRESLLKLLDSRQLVIDVKYKEQQILEVLEPVLILSNYDINHSMLSDEAFKNRLQQYQFKVTMDNTNPTYVDSIRKELPSILLYCNRLFLSRHYSSNRRYRYNKPVYNLASLEDKLRHIGFLPPV